LRKSFIGFTKNEGFQEARKDKLFKNSSPKRQYGDFYTETTLYRSRLRMPDDVTRASVFPKGKRTHSSEISIGYSIKFPKLDTASPATQDISLRLKAAAHTGCGMTRRLRSGLLLKTPFVVSAQALRNQ